MYMFFVWSLLVITSREQQMVMLHIKRKMKGFSDKDTWFNSSNECSIPFANLQEFWNSLRTLIRLQGIRELTLAHKHHVQILWWLSNWKRQTLPLLLWGTQFHLDCEQRKEVNRLILSRSLFHKVWHLELLLGHDDECTEPRKEKFNQILFTARIYFYNSNKITSIVNEL